ncbi:hypothetical protein WR25_01182 isoform B [Diploscapter pachys]|uniref:UNC80 domain-containing protein n=1 Tax=Diploscapter pachys TaxID=2018661 RepID=A0A2A2K236_9BILA|nr:hypothetical protein WR25_01182 isoform B [Diploscapter pachys]
MEEEAKKTTESVQKQKPSELLIDVGQASQLSTRSHPHPAAEVKANITKSSTANAFDISPTSDFSIKMLGEDVVHLSSEETSSLSRVFANSTTAPLVQLNDICSGISLDDDSGSQKSTTSATGQKPVATVHPYTQPPSTKIPPPVPNAAPPLVLTRASTMEDTMSSSSQQTMIPSKGSIKGAPPKSQTETRSNWSGARDKLTEASTEDELEEYSAGDPTIASYLDVAVIRALLITHWAEQGVYWALRYLLNRLEEIQIYVSLYQGAARQRSNSLPSGARRPSVAVSIDVAYQNPTWEDFKIDSDREDEDKTKLHVAFNDSNRRQSTDNALVPIKKTSETRRSSLNLLAKRERNRSDPSINNSIEGLSIREDMSGSMSNLSAKSADKPVPPPKSSSIYYPEAIGSSNFIEKNGKISLTVIVQTINQLMDRCTGVRLCELALNIADTLLRTPVDQSELFFNQITIMIFKIYLCLGCPHGCNEGVKSQQADFLRLKAKALLANLERLEQEKFKKILTDYVEEFGCQQVLDLLHSITAFCRTEFSQSEMYQRRSSESRMPSYRNKFNEKEKGIEGRIINATSKPLVTKLAAIGDQLVLPENMSLLQDVRMFINFLQEQHGNPFRRVGLSALLDAVDKSPNANSDPSRKDDGSGASSPSSLQPPSGKSDQASLRRGLFKKKEKSGGNDESEGDSSPSTPRTVSSMDDNASPLIPSSALKKKSAPKLHFAFNLLKTARLDQGEDDLSDSECADEFNDSDFFSGKRSIGSISAGGKIRGPVDRNGTIRIWGGIVPPPQYLSVNGIFEGAKRFAFLLETTKPGTFPDPPLIAALLHLKSPVLSRAALLLECAHFVSRCNRGQWPEWIRSSNHRTLSLGGPLANRGTPSATRRMHSLQRQAGRYFYQWACHIGEQLAKILEIEDEKDRRDAKIEDNMEDFFDDAIVNNETSERCPPALQLLALLLLQEITAFLRETFKTIPRSKTPKVGGASSGWDKLLSHRRWSILSNTFNPQQTGSMNSITDINSSIHSLTASSSARPPSLSVRLLSRQSTHDDSCSGHGSTKSTNYVPIPPEPPGRRVATGRQRLLKRGAPMGQQPSLESSHKRRSFKMRKASKAPHNEEEKESDGGSGQSGMLLVTSTLKRVASFRNLASESAPPSIRGLPAVSAAPSLLAAFHSIVLPDLAGVLLNINEPYSESHPGPQALASRDSLKPDEVVASSPTEPSHPSNPNSMHGSGYAKEQQQIIKNAIDEEEQHMMTNFPWIKIIIKVANSFDFECTHEGVCSTRCFVRVGRQCTRLTEALCTLYGEKKSKKRVDKRRLLLEKWNNKQQELRRSVHTRQSAVVPRRESALIGHPEGTSKAIKALLMEKMQIEKQKEEREREESILKKQSVEQEHLSEASLEQEPVDINRPMLDYIRTLVLNLVHAPLSSALKCALLLNTEQFKSMISVSWRLLLHEDPHVVLSAASMFIVTCVRRSEDAIGVMKEALTSTNPTERTEAIQRFYALWRNRYHVWLKMEDGAQAVFRVPPPGIDFTLPSPPIGQSQVPIVDPPWMPHLKTKIEELSLKEEEHATSQTIMTMTRTRRKQKQEMVKRAVREAEERQCEQRQLYRLRSAPIMQHAAYEPALFHHTQETGEESETAHHASRHVMPVAQPLFPSSILTVVPLIIEMLDDPQVDKHGVSVGDVAKKIIWTCIVEDTGLFLRHFLEKLTNRERQEILMSQLHKLILRFNPLPSQTAHTLLNYLFGFVMHYVRAQCEGAEKALGLALSLAWILCPIIPGLYFKDLKQTLKKEQCDQALMITANVPSAKKIIVHGPDHGMGGIPSQFPVHEDTQFQQILTDSLEFFNIEENEVNNYFLTDTKTGMIHLPSSYVRDFYFFHRSFYPQLTLTKLSIEEAHLKMRQTAFAQRFIEVGKVLLTHNILKYSPANVIAQRVFFLHDELTHLPSFPRKSLETCFGMHHGPMGEQLKAMEAMHKFTWAKLMADMFEKMENAFMFADLHLFINVINGIMIMHCEDLLILRRCAATYISISMHFNTLFASQGFFLIMPTLLRCYSQRQTNRVFCGVVEFLCRQFYTLHRKPFILQMCGSIANIIDYNSSDFEINPMRVKAKYWFHLLKRMEEPQSDIDEFDILGLVPYEKPLKALDLCYKDDPNTFCVLTDALASCICWTTLCVEMKALINSCDILARGPQRTFDLVGSVAERGKSFVADSPQFFDPPTNNEDENMRPYHLKEKRSTVWVSGGGGSEATDQDELQKELYRRPRDTLLCLAAQFIETASPRLKELTKLSATAEHVKIPDVLDHKCHVRLGEIALSLLKIAPYDLCTMSCPGLQKYFTVVLPVTDWSIESNRSALNIILRRLDKTIAKIAKRQSIRRRVTWGALAAWVNGICDTLNAFPYIAHLHPLKTMTQLCLRIMVTCHIV